MHESRNLGKVVGPRENLPNATKNNFERYVNFGTPDITDRGGLWLERGADGFKVVDVVAAGPAAQVGLKGGDVIVEINGRGWSECTAHRFRPGLAIAPENTAICRQQSH